jgi:hypothetical protein
MAKLPRDVSDRQAGRAFQKAGWLTRKTGPHIIMEKKGVRPSCTQPQSS